MVGGFKPGFYFPFHIWDNPSQLICFRGVETTNQRCYAKYYMLLYVFIVPMGNPREMGNLVWD